MASADRLAEVADELYAQPPADFTGARDAAAKSASDREFGKQIKALRKPSVAAWAVNLLVRREAEQIEQVLVVGESLRDAAAAMDGAQLRALTRQRRQLTAALTTTARALAGEYGVRLTPAVGDQVEGVLNAAMLDPVAADAVRSGLLVTAFTSTGVAELDLGRILAVPDAVGVRARAVHAPRLHVVAEDTSVKRERAREALEKATAAVATAQRELATAERAVDRAETRRDQARAEMDRLRQRLAGFEDAKVGLDDDADSARAQREARAADLEDAKSAHTRAAADLESLGG